MDEDLRQHLEAIGRRFDAMEGRFDAMEGRFDAMEGRFDGMEGRLENMERRLLDEILDRTQEMVRDAQTEILRGFEHYQNAAQIRFRSLEAETSNLKTAQELRLANLEERVTALELKWGLRT